MRFISLIVLSILSTCVYSHSQHPQHPQRPQHPLHGCNHIAADGSRYDLDGLAKTSKPAYSFVDQSTKDLWLFNVCHNLEGIVPGCHNDSAVCVQKQNKMGMIHGGTASSAHMVDRWGSKEGVKLVYSNGDSCVRKNGTLSKRKTILKFICSKHLQNPEDVLEVTKVTKKCDCVSVISILSPNACPKDKIENEEHKGVHPAFIAAIMFLVAFVCIISLCVCACCQRRRKNQVQKKQEEEVIKYSDLAFQSPSSLQELQQQEMVPLMYVPQQQPTAPTLPTPNQPQYIQSPAYFYYPSQIPQQQVPLNATVDTRGDQMQADEELARALQQQFERENM